MTEATVGRTARSSRFLLPVLLVGIMWLVHLADLSLPGSFTGFGVRSWDVTGLGGILIGPFLHASWPHLIGNSLPLIVLGSLVVVEGARRFWLVTASAALIGGLGAWIVNAPGTVTVGASVLVFGYFGYIVVRVFAPGRVVHRIGYALIALIVIGLYGGSMLTGIVGATAGVSWQAHLFGALGGGAVVLVRRRRTGPGAAA